MSRRWTVPILAGAFCLLTLPAWADSNRDYTERQEFTCPLAENGRVSLKSEVGEVRVHASDRRDVHIVAVKRAKNSDEHNGPGRVSELRVEVHPTPGQVSVRGIWPDRSFTWMLRGKTRLQIDFDIEVPRTARLEVQNDIGEVRIEGAANDVMVRENIGEVRIELADSFLPRRVYLHVNIGDVDTGFPGRTQGWLGKKFTAILDGERALDVRVNIGDIRVSGGKIAGPKKAKKVTEL